MEKNIKAKVISEIRQAILRYKMADKGDHIVFGLSGGPDSVCLFFAFYLMREELGITMSAVHINHKFRPGAAEEDQSYVENLCAGLGIRCRSEVCDCGEIAERLGITSEEAGRKVRYEAFDAEAAYMQEQLGIAKSQVKIAIAHNMEDQAETILFRLMRGTGTDGLSGIERKRTSENGYTII
ncbi:MAG: tRNA lysidine(34) synthetase TilS, partial [Eubacteriales Family XIII. Incertae Sedis bacterium]